jgi:hypothetical protein
MGEGKGGMHVIACQNIAKYFQQIAKVPEMSLFFCFLGSCPILKFS